METLKITCGSPELLRKLKTDVLRLLGGYSVNSIAGQQISARAAIGKVRIVQGEK